MSCDGRTLHGANPVTVCRFGGLLAAFQLNWRERERDLLAIYWKIRSIEILIGLPLTESVPAAGRPERAKVLRTNRGGRELCS